MKWIGQNIYDLIARFRNDVYLEDISSGTIASGGNLGLDSNNKIVKATDSAPDADASTKGIVELATTAETATGTDATRAVTPDGLKDGYLGSTIITTLGTIEAGTWQGTAIASAHLDADTAHLTTNQTFSGVKTFSAQTIFDGNQTLTPGDGAVIHQDTIVLTDGNTSASGTAALCTLVNIEGARLQATNSSVTTTIAASLYIKEAPSAGTNQTITNAYALYVDDGLVKFDGALTVGGTITGDVTGDLTGQADTVATIAGLAPNTATTQATQAAITTCANLATVGTITTGVWNGTAIASAYLDSDTAHLSGTQTFTGAKTFTDTVALTGTGRITGVDTVSADTDAASKVYADRPAKQIQIYHANWKGAAGTGLTYIPLAGVPDETIGSGGSVGAKESNAIIMPAAGKIKEIILRQHWTSTITTSDDITWTVYNRASNKKVNAFTAIGSTFDMVNPTQGGTDANNTRTSGEISYDFAEYDAVVISMQWASTGPTNNSDRHFVTVVVEYDFSGIGY